MTPVTDAPITLGDLRAAGYENRSVKDELRANLLAKMARGEELFPGILGFDETVVPALERGILAGHDLVLLGERGQAKTRLVRAIVNLLDETVPAIEGCEIHDDPYRPICARRATRPRSSGSRGTTGTPRSSRRPTRAART